MKGSYADIIHVTIEDGMTLYNGYETTYEALTYCDTDFVTFPFSVKMEIATEAMNELTPVFSPLIKARKLIYNFASQQGQLLGVVYDQYDLSGEIIIGFLIQELIDTNFMKNQYDIKGLRNYLLKIGEILPEDTITLIHRE